MGRKKWKDLCWVQKKIIDEIDRIVEKHEEEQGKMIGFSDTDNPA